MEGVGSAGGETVSLSKLWAHVEKESVHGRTGGVQLARVHVRAGVWPPPGILAWMNSRSHLHALALQLEYSCLQGADPTEKGLPVFC